LEPGVAVKASWQESLEGRTNAYHCPSVKRFILDANRKPLSTAQMPVLLYESIFKGVGNPHRGSRGDEETATVGTSAFASRERFSMLDVNCGTGSSSAAFRMISATNEQDGGQPMDIFAVDLDEMMVEATRTRLFAPEAKLMEDAKDEIKGLVEPLLLGGTYAVVGPASMSKTADISKTAGNGTPGATGMKRKTRPEGGEGSNTSTNKKKKEATEQPLAKGRRAGRKTPRTTGPQTLSTPLIAIASALATASPPSRGWRGRLVRWVVRGSAHRAKRRRRGRRHTDQ